MLQGKKILITGGAGFLGSNLARKLLEEQAEVTIFIRPNKNLDNLEGIKEKIKIIKGEITNPEQIKQAIKDKDFLFHLAWQTDLKKSMASPKEDISTDLIGLINILENTKQYNPQMKIIFASTVTVIGETEKLPSNEDEKEAPLSIYEANKLTGEKYLALYSKNYNLKTTVLRLSNVFGEYQRIDNPSRGVLNFMIGRALRGEVLTVYGEGDFIRDYCHVQNYVNAFIQSALSPNTEGKVFVLGSGQGKTMNEVVEKIKSITEALTQKPVNIKHVPFPESENKINKRNFIADTSRFKEATGWAPQISFEEGLKKTIEFYYKKHYKQQ